MIVANWMNRNPLTITSDALVSDARRLISEKNIHALPVVDHGRLRGLVTRANLLRTAHFVLRTQSPDELDFFASRLKVRDIMVRQPATVRSGDTMEYCMQKGRELGVAQFPVIEADTVVGVISAKEIFQLAAHCVGALEEADCLTLAPVKTAAGALGRIADIVERSGGVVEAMHRIGRRQSDLRPEEKTIVLRLRVDDMGAVVEALEAAGFSVSDGAHNDGAAVQ